MTSDKDRLEQLVAAARRDSDARDQGYREQALKVYPHICARCGREFNRHNLSELTVHHRDHNHDNNPEDGSNWELLCLYCHDNEHQRQLEANSGSSVIAEGRRKPATFNPFAGLRSLQDKGNRE